MSAATAEERLETVLLIELMAAMAEEEDDEVTMEAPAVVRLAG